MLTDDNRHDHLAYSEDEDIEFKGKIDNVRSHPYVFPNLQLIPLPQIFWRGTNTGGRSIGLNWMGWIRSRLISRLNRPAEWGHWDELLLADSSSNLITATLPSHALNAALTDVAFSAPDKWGDADSLETQRTEPSFRFSGHMPFRANYLSKAVFDLDGTAYSGRFVALMRSHSAVFKARLYKEAIDGVLVPWYHYVPVSVRLTEVYSLLGYFFGARRAVHTALDEGLPLSESTVAKAMRGVAHEADLKRIAERGREWGKKCARKADAMSYAHLLALEWARLLDDERDNLNFVLGKGEGL